MALKTRAYHSLHHYPYFPLEETVYDLVLIPYFKFSNCLMCIHEDQDDYPVENGLVRPKYKNTAVRTLSMS